MSRHFALAIKKPQFQCQSCGSVQPKWVGQCPDCNAWNSLVESAHITVSASPREKTSAQALRSIQTTAETRISTGVEELDRVLGGGIVPGSVVLIGGDPGIGKSTLLLQALGASAPDAGLYVSGEESPQQVKLRAQRLMLGESHLRFLAETQIESILAAAERERPAVMVIDSIQTVYTEQIQSAPGSVSQVRESAAQLVRHAKNRGTAVLLVGHVTKEGALAGPRVLEHMVDAVLYFEGDSGGRYRMLRAVKNRFGTVNELGIFAMTETGLKGVSNPSAIFLSRHEQPVAGSVVTVAREGTRPLLIEVQALVDQSHLSNPRRLAVGYEPNRLAMLLAVLHRHCGITMADQDVFVNVVGGVRLMETAADLAVLLAALSSFKNKPLGSELVAFGEIGLAGEIRPVPNGQERIREAERQGFKRILLPRSNAPKQASPGTELIPVSRLEDALSAML